MAERIARNSSIELLRLILMFLIIVHHSIVHGIGLTSWKLDIDIPVLYKYEQPLYILINSLCIPAVNCFVLISGYFGIKKNRKKFLSFLITVFFYTFLFDTLYFIIVERNILKSIYSLMIFSHPTYWFVNAYIYLMILAPVINLALDRFSKEYLHFILIFLLLISCYLGFIWSNPINPDGYNLFQFILMYFLGRYFRLIEYKISRQKAFLVYITSSIAVTIIMYILWDAGNLRYAWKMTYYNNPLLILAAIGLFYMLKSFNFYSPYINKLASSSFAIYLVQSSEACEYYYYKLIGYLNIEYKEFLGFTIVISAIVIMLFSIGFDQIQKKINNLVAHIINKKIY